VRVAIYARVSTDDKGQDPENQLRELRDWVTDSGHSTSITRVAGTARKSVSMTTVPAARAKAMIFSTALACGLLAV
jgi:predicted site-specific integrase-resolvase